MANPVRLSFKGGEKLERTLRLMAKRSQTAKAVNVGILADAKYPAAYSTRVEYRISPMRSVTSVAQVAFWNEFGTSRSPPRPFMRTTISEKSPRWGDSLAYVLKAANYDARRALTSMGIGIQGQMRDTLLSWTDPANAPLTVAIKGFNKPLTDEGILEKSISYEVV